MKSKKYKEIFKLKKMLEDEGIPFSWNEGWGYDKEKLEAIQNAINNKKKITIEYFSKGIKKTRQVFDGILEKGYDKDKIFIVNNVDSAYNLLQTLKFDKKIYALFENNAND